MLHGVGEKFYQCRVPYNLTVSVIFVALQGTSRAYSSIAADFSYSCESESPQRIETLARCWVQVAQTSQITVTAGLYGIARMLHMHTTCIPRTRTSSATFLEMQRKMHEPIHGYCTCYINHHCDSRQPPK